MPTPANSLNISSAGIIGFDGSKVFSGTAATQYNVMTGGSTTSTLNNVAPGATGIPLISQGAASQPAFGTATVPGGGTGFTSTTAYGIICGGTTSTAALQNTGAGDIGQYLTSNGSSSLPTFQNPPIFATSVDIGSAAIKTLKGSPVTIVPAQGEGLTIQIVSAGCYFTYGGSNVFTNGQICKLAYTNGSGAIITGSMTTATGIDGSANFVWAPTFVGIATASAGTDNQPIVMYNAGASEITGNAAGDNSITVYVTYLII